MKSFLSILLLTAMLLSCVACTSDEPQTDSNAELPTEVLTENNGPKHYEIELNMDNFNTYLTYAVNRKSGSDGRTHYIHTISGVLPYAYYENVVVTVKINGKEGSYRIILNAAGNGELDIGDNPNNKTGQIVSVSGKVIFSM